MTDTILGISKGYLEAARSTILAPTKDQSKKLGKIFQKRNRAKACLQDADFKVDEDNKAAKVGVAKKARIVREKL